MAQQGLVSFEDFEATQYHTADWVCNTLPPEIVAQLDTLFAAGKSIPKLTKWLRSGGYDATEPRLRYHRDKAHLNG